jgi:microsomal dipeptidase-like Zn-dependent dipeptidase
MVHDMLGMRYIFPIHLKHNGLGGAGNNSPIAWNGDASQKGMSKCRESGWFGALSEDGLGDSVMNRCANYGLTELGKHAVKASWDLGHFVDVDHMSRISHKQMYEMAKFYNVPIVRGHTGFTGTSVGERRHEGNISSDQIEDVLDTGGMVGGIVFQGRLDKVANYPESSIPNTCGGTSSTWFNSYEYVKDIAGNDGIYNGQDGKRYGRVTFGTDFNGYAALPIGRDQEYFFRYGTDKRKCWYGENGPHIGNKVQYPFQAPAELKTAFGYDNDRTLALAESSPGVAGSGQINFNNRGLATAGQLPDFFEDLRVQGAPVKELESVYRSALGFTDMWSRLSMSAEQSVYWFAPSLAAQYLATDYPLRKIPAIADYITTGTNTPCRFKSNGVDHYQLGVLLNQSCKDSNGNNQSDFDVLAARPSGGTHRWSTASASRTGNETPMLLNQRLIGTGSVEVKGICRLKPGVPTNTATGREGYIGTYRGGECTALGVNNASEIVTWVSQDSSEIELLIVDAGMMKKDAQSLTGVY